jgi:hypothetical protein
MNNQVHVISPPQTRIDCVLDGVVQGEPPVDGRQWDDTGSPQDTKRVPVDREDLPI